MDLICLKTWQVMVIKMKQGTDVTVPRKKNTFRLIVCLDLCKRLSDWIFQFFSVNHVWCALHHTDTNVLLVRWRRTVDLRITFWTSIWAFLDWRLLTSFGLLVNVEPAWAHPQNLGLPGLDYKTCWMMEIASKESVGDSIFNSWHVEKRDVAENLRRVKVWRRHTKNEYRIFLQVDPHCGWRGERGAIPTTKPFRVPSSSWPMKLTPGKRARRGVKGTWPKIWYQ